MRQWDHEDIEELNEDTDLVSDYDQQDHAVQLAIDAGRVYHKN